MHAMTDVLLEWLDLWLILQFNARTFQISEYEAEIRCRFMLINPCQMHQFSTKIL